MDQKMTLVLTSCGRLKILNKTLESFFKYNTYDLEKLLLVEDSLEEKIYTSIQEKWGGKIDLLFNRKKKGQIQSIVDTYKLIKTPLIFHCEDDWIYTRKNFIEDSLKILNTDKKIIQVWLESKRSASRLDIFNYGNLQTIDGIGYRRVECKDGWEWGYFSFRPGVKRMTDYDLIGGYSKFKNELDIGVEYKKRGYYTVIIEEPAVKDIGDDHHVGDPTRKWPKRRKTNAPTGLKRFWKHLKKFKF
ncbi:MAG: hypothetical protein CMM96_04290 [Rickettsiales bacterium]|nr:hypothetical protein [Rickettsiales bacterium]|tara:strand:+ start:225 stop:959 length:735 start_codon:yes stop_codon:yes gene_type:complete